MSSEFSRLMYDLELIEIIRMESTIKFLKHIFLLRTWIISIVDDSLFREYWILKILDVLILDLTCFENEMGILKSVCSNHLRHSREFLSNYFIEQIHQYDNFLSVEHFLIDEIRNSKKFTNILSDLLSWSKNQGLYKWHGQDDIAIRYRQYRTS